MKGNKRLELGLGLVVLAGLFIISSVAFATTDAALIIAAFFGGGGGRRQSQTVLVEDSLTELLYAEYRAGSSNSTPTPTPTPPPGTIGDPYEPDNTCAAARTIPTDGTTQQHTLHQANEEDWISFSAISGTNYLVEAQVPPGSPADLEMEVHAICGQATASQNWSYAPGIRLKFNASKDGVVRLRFRNGVSTVFGNHVAYQVSVSAISNAPPQGAVIIVAGRLNGNDSLQANIHNVTDAISRTFRSRGYPPERMRYLATDLGRGGVHAAPSIANLQDAITNWAMDKVGPNQPLTVYLMDHGGNDAFYLDNTRNEVLTPTQLDQWLSQLEAAHPGLKVNVIIEACYSGSFIRQPGSLSKQGRVVLTSTSSDNVAWASQTGAEFSDRFLLGVSQGQSLFDAYVQSRWAVETAFIRQVPYLDDNGDGVPNTPQDGAEAQRRGFTFAGTFGDVIWPPYIQEASILPPTQAGTRIIRALVADDQQQVASVVARVYPPDYAPPATQDQLIKENIPTVPLTDRGQGVYEVAYPLFTLLGQYRIVIFAQDTEGNQAQPVSILLFGKRTYLPFVLRPTA